MLVSYCYGFQNTTNRPYITFLLMYFKWPVGPSTVLSLKVPETNLLISAGFQPPVFVYTE